MRYKNLITSKLESFDNNLTSLYAMLSNPALTRDELDRWYILAKDKLDEIKTLVNSENESF